VELVRAGWVDQGKRYLSRYVCNRSLRSTSECFLSSLLWKVRIMMGKGKGSKVLSASERMEPVIDIPEGSKIERSLSQVSVRTKE
jgi:hypothetical protein